MTLHSHLIVRDDALQLYGFATEEERDLFLMLLGVQSVGPKVALAVLSGGSPRELIGALAAGDAARFQAVPGIGKRTAERIIVELREKAGVTLPDDGDDPRLASATTRARSPARACSSSATAARRPTSCSTAPPARRAEDLIAHALRTRALVTLARRASRRPDVLPEDELDRSLRPRRLDDFVGQASVREQLAVSIEAAAARGDALDHVLLAGPPGLGKTSLAQIVAAELGVAVRADGRPGARAQGRRRRVPDRARAARRLLRRRDPPPPARAGGDLLSRRWRTASCRSRSARAPARAS